MGRQERMYQREGLVVDSQTLWDQLSALAMHLQPSYEALPAVVFSFPLIHADETHWCFGYPVLCMALGTGRVR